MATLDAAARRQLGLLTEKQLATEFGFSRSAIDREIADERLIPVRQRVVRTAGSAVTQEQAWLAAVLSARMDVVVSHLTGTRLLGFPNYPDPDRIDLLTTSATLPRLKGVRGHRTLWLPPSHRTERGRVPVTSVERTFIDTCGAVSLTTLKKTARSLQRADARFIVRLARCEREVPVSGRRPRVPVREILEMYVPGFDPGDSDPEFDIAEVVRANGYPSAEMGIRVDVGPGRRRYIDVGWRDIKTGFEYQSDEYHLDPVAAHDDNAKLRELKRLGWDIWPLTSATSKAEVLSILAYVFRTGSRQG